MGYNFFALFLVGMVLLERQRILRKKREHGLTIFQWSGAVFGDDVLQQTEKWRLSEFAQCHANSKAIPFNTYLTSCGSLNDSINVFPNFPGKIPFPHLFGVLTLTLLRFKIGVMT